MSVAATILAVAQVLAVGKELMDLYTEGKISEEEFVERWARMQIKLPALETDWKTRQAAKKTKP